MNRRSDRTPRHAGFTLLELLVVIGLIGVITTWGYVILFRVDAEWNELRRRAELSDAADTIFETMQADFDSMVSPQLAGAPVKGVENTFNAPSRLKFDDRFALPVAGPEGQGLQRVRYFVDRENGRDLITREIVALPAGDGPAAENALYPQVNVAYLRCEFAAATDDGIEWLLGWDRPEPPEAVRVSMTLENPEFPYIQVSRKAVFDVRVD